MHILCETKIHEWMSNLKYSIIILGSWKSPALENQETLKSSAKFKFIQKILLRSSINLYKSQ